MIFCGNLDDAARGLKTLGFEEKENLINMRVFGRDGLKVYAGNQTEDLD